MFVQHHRRDIPFMQRYRRRHIPLYNIILLCSMNKIFFVQYSSYSTINEIFHNAIFFVRLYGRNISRCNILRAILWTRYSVVQYSSYDSMNDILQYNVLHTAPSTKYSIMQYSSCDFIDEIFRSAISCNSMYQIFYDAIFFASKMKYSVRAIS